MDAGFPTTPTQFGGRRGFKSLTEEQNTTLEQSAGLLLEEKLNNLIKFNEYKKLSNEEKAKEIKKLTDKSRVISRIEMVAELTQGFLVLPKIGTVDPLMRKFARESCG